jgi:hypothetical protein
LAPPFWAAAPLSLAAALAAGAFDFAMLKA